LLWQRSLEDDVATIERWGARLVLSLIEDLEFDRFEVRGLPEVVQRRQLHWSHFPIADMQPPRFATFESSGPVGQDVVWRLREGQQVLIHCAAGLGRTGTLAARLLVEFGVEPQEAIRRVRVARPGTLETVEQEAFVAQRV
jgi:ADP-ribosyl-[dinitrogen reductase] hydrolase